MSNFYNENIKLSIFGASHTEYLGISIEGIPAGFKIDFDKVQKDLNRRKGGQKNTTSRVEADTPIVISGVLNDMTTGFTITALFENKNTKSKDYDNIKLKPRPSHSDYSAYIKYNGFNDVRGGGQFSGRMTCALVFAGSICRQFLESKGVYVNSHILKIGDVEDIPYNNEHFTKESFTNIASKSIPVINNIIEDIQNTVERCAENQDSVGGLIECSAIGLPVGLGDPYFNSLESEISRLVFSIPSIKSIEFGLGSSYSTSFGSNVNDEPTIIDGKVKHLSNNNGGIVGGISNGMPIIFKVGVKPTPSIGSKQNTIDLENNENTTIEIVGRHDPCIALRIPVVLEAITSIAICNFMILSK